MRKLLLVAMVAGLCLGVSQSATANFFFPGSIIIGGGGGGNGGTGGATTKSTWAAATGCKIDKIKCECFTGLPVLEACEKVGVSVQCLTPETPYQHVEQSEEVLTEGAKQVLGQLTCSGLSNMTAYVQLPIEG